jgi:hypothetical protein
MESSPESFIPPPLLALRCNPLAKQADVNYQILARQHEATVLVFMGLYKFNKQEHYPCLYATLQLIDGLDVRGRSVVDPHLARQPSTWRKMAPCSHE